VSLQYEFICTIHDFKFGFDTPPERYPPAGLRCPACARDLIDRQAEVIDQLTRHRSMLLDAIDLKRLTVSATSEAK